MFYAPFWIQLFSRDRVPPRVFILRNIRMEIIIIITAITSTPCIRATMTISSADRLLRR